MGSLKSFIKSVRYSKTIADERATIRKESANIRTSFKDVNLSQNKRRVNIQKLLYLYILGEKTHFGQIECIKLLASSRFIDKRLGYLATSLLLDENQQILTLLTNSLVIDLNHPNQFFVSLALSTSANIMSYDLSNDIYNDIIRILASNNNYLKKKAMLVASKIIEKNPDLIDIFYQNFVKLNLLTIDERDHSIILSICQLILSFFNTEIHLIQASLYINVLPKLLIILKTLSSSSNYNPEYDILGISDPFLHVSLLKTITLLITVNQNVVLQNAEKVNPNKYSIDKLISKIHDQFNDLLTQITSNIEFGRNSGNLILYEVVNSIFKSNSNSNNLNVLGINLLGKFLTLKDNNIKYISLNTLLKVVNIEPKTIQRHQSIIINCLFDQDISIQRRSLELIFKILNEHNIRVLINELIKFIDLSNENNANNNTSGSINEFITFNYNVAKDINDFSLNSYKKDDDSSSASGAGGSSNNLNNLDLKFFITSKLISSLRHYSPNLIFFFKYLIILLKFNGNYLSNEDISFILSVISNIANNNPVNIGVNPNTNINDNFLLIRDSLFELFELSKNNLHNNGLNLINVWCIGEYFDLLNSNDKSIQPSEVIQYFEKLNKSTNSQLIHSYILTSLLKFSKFVTNDLPILAKIESLLRDYASTSININLQMKAVEYLEILALKDQSVKIGLLERVPPHTIVEESSEISLLSIKHTKSSSSRQVSGVNDAIDGVSNGAATSNSGNDFLLDLMDDTPTATAANKSNNSVPTMKNADLLSDIFGSSGTPVPTLVSEGSKTSGNHDILKFFGSTPLSSSTTANVANNFSNVKKTEFLKDSSKYPVIFDNEDVRIQLELKSLVSGQSNMGIYITCGENPLLKITDMNLLIAVSKSQKLTILPHSAAANSGANNDMISGDGNSFYIQEIRITGKEGSKLKMRVKFEYNVNNGKKQVMFDYALGKTL